MHGRNIALRETIQVLRPMCVFLVAIAVTAAAMAVKGWQSASLMLAGVIALIGGLAVIRVYRAVTGLLARSNVVRQAAAQAELHYVHVLRRIIRFHESRDRYARGRSDRIGRLAEDLARRLGLPEEDCAQLRLAGQWVEKAHQRKPIHEIILDMDSTVS